MIDKYIKQAVEQANTSAKVKGQVEVAQKVAGGVEGFKKEKGIALRTGGFIAKGCGKVMSNRRKTTKVY
jgi:hypothetical protein